MFIPESEYLTGDTSIDIHSPGRQWIFFIKISWQFRLWCMLMLAKQEKITLYTIRTYILPACNDLNCLVISLDAIFFRLVEVNSLRKRFWHNTTFLLRQYMRIHKKSSRPRWLSRMRVRLKTRRSRVRTPPRSATFFRGDWSWNIFYGHSLPSADSSKAVVSFWRKNVHNTD